MRNTTHANIVAFHQRIQQAHKEINGFYRFNWNEINNAFRRGIPTPALLLESHSMGLKPNANGTAHFSERAISFLLLDHTGKADNYTKQEEVLDRLENIMLDICTYLNKISKDPATLKSIGKIDLNSIEVEKVGPVFDNMYGWNIRYLLTAHEPLCYDATRWEW
ncbi:hypothetical protein [Flavobacterium columnare]|uniref:Uncharacterized protein n=1 Tax=Flavobacterium columnare (strain ATCC 49512 / CIP 103533 / TG 44/87) TaxID=1041826 RepID=G8X9D4_FLACA|nr:hypothetical protein [Flavobacterium columnare]AEW85881.1 hypothetical protein FCOL_05280 [Flavobacterium columnare ATCC 49512]